MAELGLVERHAVGRALKPPLWYDHVEIDLGGAQGELGRGVRLNAAIRNAESQWWTERDSTLGLHAYTRLVEDSVE